MTTTMEAVDTETKVQPEAEEEKTGLPDATEEEPRRVTAPAKGEGGDSAPDWASLWSDQDKYIDFLERKLQGGVSDDASRREHLLIVRLATKEQELQELSNQIAELKAAQAPSTAAMRNALLDPAVNIVFQKMKKELELTKAKLAQTTEEMSAWKFTPDSVTGKRLMAKCRQLLQENEEIGKMISSGKLAKLEGELAMQKRLCEEMKKNQVEMDEFVQELDEEMEGMQSTIYLLQQQLKEAKKTISTLESKLQDQEMPEKPPKTPTPEPPAAVEGESSKSRHKTSKPSPVKSTESPVRRGRSAKKPADEVEDNEDGPSRPKRRRAAPQRFEGGSKKSAADEGGGSDDESRS